MVDVIAKVQPDPFELQLQLCLPSLTCLCDAACSQVAHPSIKDQLVAYIYNGFLVPVLAPALHKVGLHFFYFYSTFY